MPQDPTAPWQRADLAFENVEHDGPSFRVLLYLNNANADESTGRDVDSGYAAEFPVFAHGACWGDAGHCEVREPASAFDHRPPPPLTPIAVSVDVTDALRRVADEGQVTVTAVAFSTDESRTDVLRFSRLHLLTYD